MRFFETVRATGGQTSIMKIWLTPVDFDLPEENAEYYSAVFLFDHKRCEYVEVHEDVADPSSEPIILIPLIVGDRIIHACYQIIYRDKKYIGTAIKVWPDNYVNKFNKYAEPLVRTFFQLQAMEDFRAAYNCRVFSEIITRKRCNSQKTGVQPSGHNPGTGDESPT